MERKLEIKERITMFTDASNEDVEKIMAELTDDNLLDNDINFVNGA
jgi:hypothetical protein